MNKTILIVLLVPILICCATQRTSTLEGTNYDQIKNQTDYFDFPYGSVSFPGKWEKAHYNSISGQQFFTNDDSIRLAIAFNKFDKYEFNSDGLKKGYDFVKAFYEWDSRYFLDTYGMQRILVEDDSTNNYVVYQIYGNINGGKFDTYYLIGERNGIASNLSIMITDKWTKENKIHFLKELFSKKL